jgi:hypothetical protein
MERELMEQRVYEVVADPRNGGWRLERTDGLHSKVFPTRIEAVVHGDAQCREERPAKLVVRAADGRVVEARTYERT